jgi:hypothetical protein
MTARCNSIYSWAFSLIALTLFSSAIPALYANETNDWFTFKPAPESAEAASLDLRWMNEKEAGSSGFIVARDGSFIHSCTGKEVRFWAVNGPPEAAKDPEQLKLVARSLARRGVNLVRLHTPIFNASGEVSREKVAHAHRVVEAMKGEGIYTLFSIYFPLWFKPGEKTPWLEGYDGSKHPFAALYFNEKFQERYREWWRALLVQPNAKGKSLIHEPAVLGVELVNEDSFFFWTFQEQNIPAAQLKMLESKFAQWAEKAHGSLEKTLERWNGVKHPRDSMAEKRLGFRPLWNIFSEKNARDQDTARFLYETQRDFYQSSIQFLRGLGFRGLVTPSNWTTASAEVFGPIEKLTYTVGDFIDRHGYFSCNHKGEHAEWSIRNGHTYSDRSALRFDAEQPDKPRSFVHPVMDPSYNNMPSMISETTWNRPNRYRSEAPLFFAVYGALQGSDAIVHFAHDGATWAVKPNFWMQPWTLSSPAMLGQFPAAALIFRHGLVSKGNVLASVRLNKNDVLALKGTPLPQDAAFDELRLKDVPLNATANSSAKIPSLIHFAGQAKVTFSDEPSQVQVEDLSRWIKPNEQTVVSSTEELSLDYGKGVLRIAAPAAQGVSGHLKEAGKIDLPLFSVESGMELGHIVVVAMDGLPLGRSTNMLLQVMSEEKNNGWKTEPIGLRSWKIQDIGSDPWLVRKFSGTVTWKGRSALRIVPIDFNGNRSGPVEQGNTIQLQPTTLYYRLSR